MEEKESTPLKKWETPVLNMEGFGSTLGGHHLGLNETLTGTIS